VGSVGATKLMSNLAVAISARAGDVEVLASPADFYAKLLELSAGAERHVSLSSLYLGTDAMEQELVDTLLRRSEERPELDVHVMLDYQRGIRPVDDKSSVTMLRPLLEKSAAACLSLFHVPCSDFPLSYVLRGRAREILGVHHIKLYIFDDNVIISGANLSEIYFKQRQDRYVLIKNNPTLAAFYRALLSDMRHSPFSVNLTGDAQPPASPPYPTKAEGVVLGKQLLERFRAPEGGQQLSGGHDTWLFPTVQMGFLGLRHDENIARNLLRSMAASPSLVMDITSGYTNFTNKYTRLISESTGQISVICASPQANGFYQAKGFAEHIEPCYNALLKDFLDKLDFMAVLRAKADIKVMGSFRAQEYYREGWTYHAKGLWLRSDSGGPSSPLLTCVGSSNFGARSAERDTESQLVVVTSDPELRGAFLGELDNIRKHCHPITSEQLTSGETPTPRKPLDLPTILLSQLFRSYL
jgi:CDP-diacylglycerol--glycerol-3-phosphate 3-phosphatidyltransferase